MNIVRTGDDYEQVQITNMRLRELLHAEKNAQQEHLTFVAVMNALDVHMPPDGANLLREIRQIAETTGYPWRGGLGAAAPSEAAPK